MGGRAPVSRRASIGTAASGCWHRPPTGPVACRPQGSIAQSSCGIGAQPPRRASAKNARRRELYRMFSVCRTPCLHTLRGRPRQLSTLSAATFLACHERCPSSIKGVPETPRLRALRLSQLRRRSEHVGAAIEAGLNPCRACRCIARLLAVPLVEETVFHRPYTRPIHLERVAGTLEASPLEMCCLGW